MPLHPGKKGKSLSLELFQLLLRFGSVIPFVLVVNFPSALRRRSDPLGDIDLCRVWLAGNGGQRVTAAISKPS